MAKASAPTKAAAKKPANTKTAAKKTTAATATPAPTPVVEAVPAPEPTVEVKPEEIVNKVEETVPEDDLTKTFGELMKKLQTLTMTFASLKQDFKTLEKKYNKEMKTLSKASAKKRKVQGKPRAPSGFIKPTRISEELALFLGKPDGTEMARTEVTREINKYIRTNDLQDPVNGRKIIPDDKLRVLLQVPTSDDLTYFNLQKYLSKHFPKPVTATAAGTSA